MRSNDAAIHQVIERTIQDVINLNIGYQLSLNGLGGSIDHKTGKEKTIDISFELNHALSKDACRWLVVNIAQLLLANINNDQNLRQYLPDEGFTYKNLRIGIGFLTPNHTFLFHPDITYVSLYEGEISYATTDPKDINVERPYKEIIYEPYEESLEIVESQDRPEELSSTIPK